MASVKLTKGMREQIAARLLNGLYAEEYEQVRQHYASLAEHLYTEHYPADVREKMYDLPEGWLPTAYVVHLNLGGQWRELRFNGHWSFSSQNEDVHRRVLAEDHAHRELRVKARMGDDPIAEEVQRADNWLKDLKTRHRKVKAEVWAVLNSVTTLRRLGQVWPECWDKVKDLERQPAATAGLPAKRLTELSNELNLKD